MPRSTSYLEQLAESEPLREPVIRAIVDYLQLPVGSRGLDAGCGIGGPALILAEAVGAGGHVTGLDLSGEFIAHARKRAEDSPLRDRVSFRQGNVTNLPYDGNCFDWAWSADCVGYAPMEPLSTIKEMARVVKPGGQVAVLMWSAQQLLPGHPALEARLNATSMGIAPYRESMPAERHFLRLLGWLRKAGLRDASAKAFAGSAHAPLSDDIRTALASLIDMRWPGVQAELGPKDRQLYQRLCREDSPEYVLNLHDYYAFFTYSLFRGRVA